DGHNLGWHTIYFDKDGNKVRNVAHHRVTETHRNLSTGRTVDFRGDYTSTYDYAANTQTFTGVFRIANERLQGTCFRKQASWSSTTLPERSGRQASMTSSTFHTIPSAQPCRASDCHLGCLLGLPRRSIELLLASRSATDRRQARRKLAA